MLTSTRFRRILAFHATPRTLAEEVIRTRKSGARQDMAHLHVWSGLWAEGLPQAIFRSLQNRQASACFFCSPFFLGALVFITGSPGAVHVAGPGVVWERRMISSERWGLLLGWWDTDRPSSRNNSESGDTDSLTG
jgi:hypothetical protein